MPLVSNPSSLPSHNSTLPLTHISNKRRKPLKQSFCNSNNCFYSNNNRHNNRHNNCSSNNSNRKSMCANNSSSSCSSSSSNNNCNSNRIYLQLSKTYLRPNSLYKSNLLVLGTFLFLVHLLFPIYLLLLGRTKNPFAPSPSISPSNQTQQQRRPSPAFNLPSTYELHSPSHVSLSSSPVPVSHTPSIQQESQGRRPLNVKKKEDENETLAALFADREGGQDTFGNIGALRFVPPLFFSKFSYNFGQIWIYGRW